MTNDASPSFLDRSSDRQEIAMPAIQDKRETLVRDAEHARSAGNASARILERFSYQVAFVTKDFSVQ